MIYLGLLFLLFAAAFLYNAIFSIIEHVRARIGESKEPSEASPEEHVARIMVDYSGGYEAHKRSIWLNLAMATAFLTAGLYCIFLYFSRP